MTEWVKLAARMTEPSTASPVQARRYSLQARRDFVRARFGEHGWTQLFKRLSNVAREEFDVAQDGWIPGQHLIDITVCMDDLFGAGDLALAWELGRFSALNYKGPWRELAMKFAPPSLVMKLAAEVWQHHWSAGRLVTKPGMRGKGVTFSLEDFPTPHRAVCLSMAGWAEASGELGPRRNVRIREIICAARGQEACRFEATWDDA